MTVDALGRAQETEIATGSLLTLDNQIDTGTGTVKLKAIFPNEDDSLFPNQFVNAKLLLDTHRDAILIPASAIQRNAQGAFVYVVNPDQTLALRSITVGTVHNNVAEVPVGRRVHVSYTNNRFLVDHIPRGHRQSVSRLVVEPVQGIAERLSIDTERACSAGTPDRDRSERRFRRAEY